MIIRLMEKLQNFTDRLDQGSRCTASILKAIELREIAAVENLTNNRERLLNIVAKEQEDIEKVINSIIDEELTPENINIIKSWAFDTQNWINAIADKDDQIIEMLNESKDETTREIAGLFKSKQAFRGYNLNDVRK
jgi:Tfp pilus assembly protein PilW